MQSVFGSSINDPRHCHNKILDAIHGSLEHFGNPVCNYHLGAGGDQKGYQFCIPLFITHENYLASPDLTAVFNKSASTGRYTIYTLLKPAWVYGAARAITQDASRFQSWAEPTSGLSKFMIDPDDEEGEDEEQIEVESLLGKYRGF